ncbi:MAG: hypothetical protein KDD61_08705 [Bdellovibrionales bacterium]|nr:hypothetical protein [Bdellovibrionales bacterium]
MDRKWKQWGQLILVSAVFASLPHCGDNPEKDVAGRDVTTDFINSVAGEYYKNGQLQFSIQPDGTISSATQRSSKTASIVYYSDNDIYLLIDGRRIDIQEEKIDTQALTDSHPQRGQASQLEFQCNTSKQGIIHEAIEVQRPVKGRRYRWDVAQTQKDYPYARYLISGYYHTKKTTSATYKSQNSHSLFQYLSAEKIQGLLVRACDLDQDYHGNIEVLQWRLINYTNQYIYRNETPTTYNKRKPHALLNLGNDLFLKKDVASVDLTNTFLNRFPYPPTQNSDRPDALVNSQEERSGRGFEKWKAREKALSLSFNTLEKRIFFTLASGEADQIPTGPGQAVGDRKFTRSCKITLPFDISQVSFDPSRPETLNIKLLPSKIDIQRKIEECGSSSYDSQSLSFVLALKSQVEPELQLALKIKAQDNGTYYHNVHISTTISVPNSSPSTLTLPQLLFRSEI